MYRLNNIHTKQQLVELVSSQIEASPSSLLQIINDTSFTHGLGLTRENVLSFFIPNTYQMYWNTSASQFITKMRLEYNRFWTADRKNLAAAEGLTTAQVGISMCSVLSFRWNQAKKMKSHVITGVYMNRLKKGMALQADPTVVYALGDFLNKKSLERAS